MSGCYNKGQMPIEGRLKIQNNHEYLLEEIMATPIANWLFSEFVIKADELELIEIEERSHGRRGGVKKLLQVIILCGEDSYIKFIEALDKNGFKPAAKKLNETDVTDQVRAAQIKPYSWIDSIDKPTLQKALTEPQISSFSTTFGASWESVALHLGCTQAQISQSKMSNQYSVHMQVFTTLNKWRQKKASGATLGDFLTALRVCESAEIDWDKVKEIVDKMI